MKKWDKIVKLSNISDCIKFDEKCKLVLWWNLTVSLCWNLTVIKSWCISGTPLDFAGKLDGQINFLKSNSVEITMNFIQWVNTFLGFSVALKYELIILWTSFLMISMLENILSLTTRYMLTQLTYFITYTECAAWKGHYFMRWLKSWK